MLDLVASDFTQGTEADKAKWGWNSRVGSNLKAIVDTSRGTTASVNFNQQKRAFELRDRGSLKIADLDTSPNKQSSVTYEIWFQVEASFLLDQLKTTP